MTATAKLRSALHSKKGSAAVEFIATASFLILTVAMLISAMIYVTQFYNASYICRRVVRTIEITGKYDEETTRAVADGLGGDALEDLDIDVNATYYQDKCIQLRDEFTVKLTANYRINILEFGDTPYYVDLPIQIQLSGRSEVYWK